MLYREKQTSSLWTYLFVFSLLGGGAITTGWGIYLQNGGFFSALPLFLYLIVVVFILDLSTMTTEVTPTEIDVHWGNPISIRCEHIPVKDIHTVSVVTYHPLWDSAGWGYRHYKFFQGKKCSFLNMRGNQGVLIEGDSFRWVIGSQTPEQLATVLRNAIPSDTIQN